MFRAKLDSLKSKTFYRGLASNTVARAFALSLLAHIVLISGMELGRGLGFWRHSLLPNSSRSALEEEVARTEKLLQEQIRQALNQVPEAQLVFVEVDPSQAIPEPPKDTKYYSSQSSIASNPDPSDKAQPKIDGTQDKVVKTFDVLKPDPRALQPTPAQPAPEPKVAESKTPAKTQPEQTQQKTLPRPILDYETKPTRPQESGETLLARAAPRPQPETKPQTQPQRRPRTVAEAKAQKGIIEGQRSRQEGGARKHSLGTNLDVRATPFGAYDAAFIQAVQSRWYNLLDERQFVGNDSGKVVVEFRLNFDGSITALRVAESEVNEMLEWYCQRAVLDPAPYRPFPSDLRRMLNNNYREIRFTFYYNQ